MVGTMKKHSVSDISVEFAGSNCTVGAYKMWMFERMFKTVQVQENLTCCLNPITAAFSSEEDSDKDISSDSEHAPYNVLVGTLIGKCGQMN